jgi:chitosanase
MRPFFGGGPEDVYLVTDTENDLQAGGGFPALFYEGEEPEAPQITDLQDIDGDPITFILTSDGTDGHAKGQIPMFQGSDELWQMWCSVNGSPRFLLTGKVGPAVGQMRQEVASILAGGAGGVQTALAGLTDVDGAAVSSAPEGAALIRRSGGVWSTTTAPTNYQLTGPQAIPLPFGAAVDGERRRWRAQAAGTDRTATFDAGFRTSDRVPARAIVIPAGQVLMAEAEYSSLLTSWVLTNAVITTGVAGTGPAAGLSAGVDTALTTAQTFSRTATEPEGATITAREWKILAGPLGVGMVVGSTAAVTWKPGSSTNGSNDIRNPTFQEIALQMTSTSDRTSTTWTAGYATIATDPGAQLGYVGGIAGFSSATGSMLQLIQQYAIEKTSGNTLSSYIPGLQTCVDVGKGSGAAAAATANLGSAFLTAWANAANTDAVFRKVQRDFRKALWWDDALTQALADGVGPLGLAIYYDIMAQHGPGTVNDSFGGILSYVRQRNTKPASGGNMATWLNAIVDRRNTILEGRGDTASAVSGRVAYHRIQINGGTVGGVAQAANLNLVAPIKWSNNGNVYTISARPDPAADSVIGEYVLRYTATGAGTDDVIVTVA